MSQRGTQKSEKQLREERRVPQGRRCRSSVTRERFYEHRVRRIVRRTRACLSTIVCLLGNLHIKSAYGCCAYTFLFKFGMLSTNTWMYIRPIAPTKEFTVGFGTGKRFFIFQFMLYFLLGFLVWQERNELTVEYLLAQHKPINKFGAAGKASDPEHEKQPQTN